MANFGRSITSGESAATGTYQFNDLSGRALFHPWNVEHLKINFQLA